MNRKKNDQIVVVGTRYGVQATSLLGVQAVLSKARAGDHAAARLALLFLSAAIREGKQLTPGLSAFLAQALSDIAKGKDPKRALHLGRGRGKRNDAEDAQFRALQRAGKVFELRRAAPGKKRITLEAAFAAVSEEEGVSSDMVQKNWKTYGKDIVPSGSGWGYYGKREKG